MRDGKGNPRSERLINLIVQQVDRLNSLVDELLSLANIEQSRLSIHRVPSDLLVLIHDVIERFRLVYPQRSLIVEQCVEHCQGAWDINRLDQVFSNLIENALKYSPADTAVRVRIEAAPEDGALDMVQVSVIDCGIGIPEIEQAKLFGKFYRASNAEAYQKGLGLGLFISAEIVRLHGGTIMVESVEGEGSTFTVRLPVLDPEEVSGEPISSTTQLVTPHGTR
jgi:signal transduction histidine kinase